MFSSLFSVFPTLLVGLLSLVNAAPVAPVEFLAYAPDIITPNADTVWVTGSQQAVSWKTDSVPKEAQNYTVTVLLGFMANNSENLDIRNPLASQIPIMQGTVTVTVPLNATCGNNSILAVIGDSGDVSPTFTINPSE